MGPKRDMVPLLQKSVPVNAAGGRSIRLTGNPGFTANSARSSLVDTPVLWKISLR